MAEVINSDATGAATTSNKPTPAMASVLRRTDLR